jgi:hypothetical protein
MQTENVLSDLGLISDHDFAEIIENRSNGYRSLVSKRDFDAGELVSSFSAGKIQATPTYLTVQLTDSKHISLYPEFLQYINHSCDPNVIFDTMNLEVRAIRDIAKGEPFSFFYPSTEWDMDQPFKCHCNTKQCHGMIKGARHLDKKVLYAYYISPFIKEQKEREI